jgi:hypothetical protein
MNNHILTHEQYYSSGHTRRFSMGNAMIPEVDDGKLEEEEIDFAS